MTEREVSQGDFPGELFIIRTVQTLHSLHGRAGSSVVALGGHHNREPKWSNTEDRINNWNDCE